MKRIALAVVALAIAMPAMAQSSGSFSLEGGSFNLGGVPRVGTLPSSGSYTITIGSAGQTAIIEGSTDSASFRIDLGFVPGFPPPLEVTGVSFMDNQTLVWFPGRTGADYNLYRAGLTTLTTVDFGSCLQQDLPDELAVDSESPSTGSGYFYIVTAENRIGLEGTKGFGSGGTERLGNACP